MADRRLRIRLGLFVLLALVLLATLIVIFGSLPTLFQRTNTYTIRFSDAPGVAAGTPVRRSGVRIGQVEEVILDEERGIVRVRVAIDRRFQIRHSEQPTLVMGLLGGDASIDFVPRTPDEGEPLDRSPVEPGAELVGTRAVSVSTLLTRASEVVPTTQETLNDIRKSMQRIERLAARLEKMTPLADETMREYRDLARTTRESIPDVMRTNEEVRELAHALREALPEARAATREVGELARTLRQEMPELERTNAEVRELARSAREAIPTLRATAEDIGVTARTTNQLAERLNVLLQSNQDKIEKSLDNLNETLARTTRLLSDPNLKNVESTLNNLRSGSEPLPSMSRSADDILNQGRTTVRRMNDSLVRLERVLTDMEKVSRPAGERGERVTKNLDETLEKLNATMGDVRAFMGVLDRSDGTLRRFLTDPSLYNNLDSAACAVVKMMPRLDRILKDFETFADKLARHPEAIGLGGVVRPGSGLKDPPTPPLPPGGAAPGPAPSESHDSPWR